MAARERAGDLRRAIIRPDKVTAPGVVTTGHIEAHARKVRERKMRLALETIAKLEMFDDPADAARAAVAIAKEALK